MQILRTWILGVTVLSMILAAAQALMPEGAVKLVSRLTCGLALTLALLQPLMSLERVDFTDLVSDLPAGSVSAEEQDPMTPIIEEELAAYIEEKAGEFGLSCAARVTCRPDENGVPLPRSVQITGRLTGEQRQTLSAWIARDLGIPAGEQSFREG